MTITYEHTTEATTMNDTNTSTAFNDGDKANSNRERSEHLGDLMGMLPGCLRAIPDDFGPLERVILTANGNVQRIISSYYNKKVSVRLRYNNPRVLTPHIFDREVELLCCGVIFCVARSVVTLMTAQHVEAVTSRQVGIGQLFQQAHVLPVFELLSAGHCNDSSVQSEELDILPTLSEGGFWRRYTLSTDNITCEIAEVFCSNLFNLESYHG